VKLAKKEAKPAAAAKPAAPKVGTGSPDLIHLWLTVSQKEAKPKTTATAKKAAPKKTTKTATTKKTPATKKTTTTKTATKANTAKPRTKKTAKAAAAPVRSTLTSLSYSY
jgi:histone H1/5